MALLTKEGLDRVVELLVSEGLADPAEVQRVQQEAAQTKRSLMEALAAQRIVTNEMIAHATAVVMGVPYVDLKNVEMDQAVFSLLPLEVAERSMVVPLGESNGQLVVAMLDVGNIQTVDYLSTFTGEVSQGSDVVERRDSGGPEAI